MRACVYGFLARRDRTRTPGKKGGLQPDYNFLITFLFLGWVSGYITDTHAGISHGMGRKADEEEEEEVV